MIAGNCMRTVCNYASNTPYCSCPTDEQIEKGVIPLDSLPADWWNWMWNDTNGAVNEAKTNFNSVISELVTVLCCAGITPQSTCVDQLYRAVNCLRQTIATSGTAGAVKSSAVCGEVSVADTGIMTANGLGNVTNLTTSARTTVVAAVNELKATYDCCITDITGNITGLGNSKAPTMHASSDTTYGVGNGSCYGHLKISDCYDSCVGGAAAGMAASQEALYCMYSAITGAGYVTLGNIGGYADTCCVEGYAGICNTASRSDHKHPAPLYLRRNTVGDCGTSTLCFSTGIASPLTICDCQYYLMVMSGLTCDNPPAGCHCDERVYLRCAACFCVGKACCAEWSNGIYVQETACAGGIISCAKYYDNSLSVYAYPSCILATGGGRTGDPYSFYPETPSKFTVGYACQSCCARTVYGGTAGLCCTGSGYMCVTCIGSAATVCACYRKYTNCSAGFAEGCYLRNTSMLLMSSGYLFRDWSGSGTVCLACGQRALYLNVGESAWVTNLSSSAPTKPDLIYMK